MTNSRFEPLLQAALSASSAELSASSDLSVGHDADRDLWQVIIRYNGSFETIRSIVQPVSATELLEGYGLLTLSRSSLSLLGESPQITYVEKPKALYFELLSAKASACISSLQNRFPDSFTGKGTITAIIDSGIDYTHPDFIGSDNKSRILALWDQTIPASPQEGTFPPDGYQLGTLYTHEQLDLALSSLSPLSVCPSIDISGHGTHVAGIAAGNGAASGGRYKGVAFESDLLIVKLQSPGRYDFPSTAQLMQAVDFCVRYAAKTNRPMAINLSFGNSYGSHSGESLLETYLDQVSLNGRISIIVGAGNEGASAGHVSGQIAQGQKNRLEFSVGDYQPGLNLQFWKNYWDTLSVTLFSPDGSSQMIPQNPGSWRFRLEDTSVFIYVGEPTPYSMSSEIYIEFFPDNEWITPGIWRMEITGRRIRQGDYQLWMPVGSTRSSGTQFLAPSPDLTLTIPSTASRVISVGAYDSNRQQPADFSGRGFTWNPVALKPELVAPGVDIISCVPGGSYDVKSGTSFAAPFVTGSCAVLMQWGIVDGNDPFLYGDKLKAYLIQGSAPFIPTLPYPNPQIGWGAICLRNSI